MSGGVVVVAPIAAGPVTIRAVAGEQLLALACERFVDVAARVGGRGQVPGPIPDAEDSLAIDRDRCDAGAQRGAQVALVDRGVVAVPVQEHPLPGALQPVSSTSETGSSPIGKLNCIAL